MGTFSRRLLRATTALTLAAGIVTALPSVSEAETVVTVVPAVSTVDQTVRFVAAHTEIDQYDTTLIVCRTPDIAFGAYYTVYCPGGEWALGHPERGQVATASFQPSASDIGVNDYYAFRCTGAVSCAEPIAGTFIVAGVAAPFASDGCDAGGTNILSGFVLGGSYVKARWKQADGLVSLCLVYESGGHYGGRLTFAADATSAVDVDQDTSAVAACANDPNNVSVQSGTVLGGQPYWIHVTPAPTGSSDAAWVCVRFTSALGLRLRVTDVDGVFGFEPDPLYRRMPPYPTPGWPVTGPSATCKAAQSQPWPYYDLEIGDDRAAMYVWQESATTTHYCLRGGETGGRLTVKTDVASSVAVGSSTAPCPFDVVTRTDEPSYGLYLSDPTNPGLPVSVCGAVAGSAVSVTVNSPDSGVVTWSPDPS